MLQKALLAALGFFALTGAGTAHAQYDPALKWSTLDTPHFRLHFHNGEEQLAQRAARAAEAARSRLQLLLGPAPELTEVVLSDDTDSANGFATALFYPNVHLYAVPPDDLDELNDYDDYLWQLITHEYTHIVHLDDISGLPKLVNHVIGQMDVPNGVQPRWFIEGLAVFEETNLGAGGRSRSSLYEMTLRAQLLSGRLFRLDEASNDPTVYPRGATPYVYGSRFLAFLASEQGEPAIAAYSHEYGGRLIPFAYNASTEHTLGGSFTGLFERWQKAQTATLQHELDAIRQAPVTPVTRLTRAGDGTGQPQFVEGGKRLAYLYKGADKPPELRTVALDGSDDRRVLELPSADDLAISSDGRFAVIARAEVYREFNVYDDLWRIELASGSSTRLTHGLRAHGPSLSRDGTRIACSVNLPGARMGIAIVPADGGPSTFVYTAAEGDQVYTPRFSPDGKSLVFSLHHHATRDLVLLDLQTGEPRDLTDDAALDLEPSFSPSGEWVLFTSDRTGVYDIYALRLADGEVRQLTNVETGAFRPVLAADGHTLALDTFTSDGFDVGFTRVDLESAPPAPPSRDDRPEPAYQDDPSVTYPVRAYSVWPTILPKYWLPVLTVDAAGTALGVVTSGSDILGKHSWNLQAYWSFHGNEPGGFASYTNHTLYPAFTLSGSRALYFLAGGPPGTLERQTAADIAMDVPVSWIDRALHFDVDYSLRGYEPLPYVHHFVPDGPSPFIPRTGLAGSIGAGVSWGTARGSTNGISAEEGYTLHVGGRVAAPWLGGDFSYQEVTASGTAYLHMPWALHQVLALRLEGGTGGGDLLGRSLFVLGGVQGFDLVNAVLSGTTADPGLRGYPGGAFAGDHYVLGSAEYRTPIANLDRGFELVPLYLRRVHGALTFDVGEAAPVLTFAQLAPSVGGELNLDVEVGYQLPFTFRFGLARGLAEKGIWEFYLALGGGF
ncbi:MAG: PD40 domain-containing protein [Deltaproteobacteria bacterium]|nr:PD40 domain-containing protein [Deltaproteobacteria bacterium]